MAKLLQHWMTLQAEGNPDGTAVVLAPERIAYGRLEACSNQLARVLREGSGKKGSRVCLLMPKSPAAVAAILGVLKADAIYVPLDPMNPVSRLAGMIRSCEPSWILAGGSVAPLLDEIFAEGRLRSAISVGWMGPEKTSGDNFQTEFSMNDLLSYPAAPLEYRNNEDDPAYILFTSGSTGQPKGVVITHSNVIRFVEWAKEYFGISASDRISCHSPLHFDLSVFDLFGSFAAGAQLHLVSPEVNILPHKLADFIRQSELTHWFSVPSVLNHMAKFDVVRFGDFPHLRRLLWCGEVFPTPALVYWMKRLPHATFTNLYGPTEATIASSYYTVPECPDDEKAQIPIGVACRGEGLLVLDEKLQPVCPGEVGDLYIRGVGLSPGYWRDPEKTRAVFLPNPHSPDRADRIYKTGDLARVGADGSIYFIGRADSQIKSRGYRIELGEIEAALHAMGVLQECAVVAVPSSGFGGNLICCSYVTFPGSSVTPAALRKELGKALPSYMIPSSWMAMERLPKNGNGKIDRRKLKEAFLDHEDSPHR